MIDESQKLAFNDQRYTPTRPEIDTMLGVLPAIELKRFEEGLDKIESRLNWSFEWYDNAGGWGYRASYLSRVVCIVHFFKGYFTVLFSVPLAREEEFRAVRELTAGVRLKFDQEVTLSPAAKWISVRLWKRDDVEAVLALMKLKVADLREKRKK